MSHYWFSYSFPVTDRYGKSVQYRRGGARRRRAGIGGWPQGTRHRATTQSIRLTTRLGNPIKSSPHSPPSGAILALPRSSIHTQPIIKKKHITSHHITSHHITSHHITSHHITSHHITSHHITITTHLQSITRILFPKVEPAFEM